MTLSCCNLIIILSWFLQKTEQFLSSFSRTVFFESPYPAFVLYGLPVLLILPACPVPDHPLGNLCRYTKYRLRSYE